MMESMILYIGLGVLDAAATITLILSLYMLPAWEYRYKIIVAAVIIAFSSYLFRVALGIPKLDLPFQYILFILLMRIGLKIRSHLAAFICGAGISAYAALQMVLYYILDWTDIVHVGVLKEIAGDQLYIFQLTSILLAFVISGILRLFKLGFSFIILPPHDFLVKENYRTKRNKLLLFSNLISLITIILTLAFLYRANPLGLLLMAAIAFGISYYFSSWSDRDDIGKSVAAYRAKNKRG